jgi:hypothetical protein
MRKATPTTTNLLFFTPISSGSIYTLSLFLIPRFKSIRNVSNIIIVFPDFPFICFNIRSELENEYLLFYINFKMINKTLRESLWKLITNY